MTNTDATGSFTARLQLILKALSLTRGRLAAELGVDKSLVGRWVSGTVKPSALNLERLTAFVAKRQPGFNLLDWDRDLDVLAEKFGVAPPGPPTAETLPIDGLLPDVMVRESAVTTQLRGWAYEGFWRTTRASAEVPGSFFHDYVMFRRNGESMLEIRMGVFALRLQGWAIMLQNKIFAISTEPNTGTFSFSILSGVARQRADVLDGISLACLRDAGGTPIAFAVLMERLGMLSGDRAADDVRFEEICQSAASVATADEVPPRVQKHLMRNAGADALAAGGAPILMIPFAQSLSRGPLFKLIEEADADGGVPSLATGAHTTGD